MGGIGQQHMDGLLLLYHASSTSFRGSGGLQVSPGMSVGASAGEWLEGACWVPKFQEWTRDGLEMAEMCEGLKHHMDLMWADRLWTVNMSTCLKGFNQLCRSVKPLSNDLWEHQRGIHIQSKILHVKLSIIDSCLPFHHFVWPASQLSADFFETPWHRPGRILEGSCPDIRTSPHGLGAQRLHSDFQQ